MTAAKQTELYTRKMTFSASRAMPSKLPPRLEHLRLVGCNLRALPATVSPLKRLRVLDLQDNKLQVR